MKAKEYIQILEAIFQLLDEGVHVIDEQGETVFCNEAMAKLKKVDRHDSALLRALREGRSTIDSRQICRSRNGQEMAAISSAYPLLSEGRIIGAVEVVKPVGQVQKMSDQMPDIAFLADRGLDCYLREIETRLIRAAMQEHNQNISRAARQLQIRRQTLQYKLRILKDE